MISDLTKRGLWRLDNLAKGAWNSGEVREEMQQQADEFRQFLASDSVDADQAKAFRSKILASVCQHYLSPPETLADDGFRIGLAVAAGGLLVGALDTHLILAGDHKSDKNFGQQLQAELEGLERAHETERKAISAETSLDQLIGGTESRFGGEVVGETSRAILSSNSESYARGSLAQAFDAGYMVSAADTYTAHLGEQPGQVSLPCYIHDTNGETEIYDHVDSSKYRVVKR